MASPLVKATNPRDLHNYVLTIKFINKKQYFKFENQPKRATTFFFFIVSVICLKEGKIQVT